ncbi:MAG: autotransporter outer membrane beta-barrel domain-containing protein [Opitutaceae bacterium]|jgi:outer membrane autotransporter protein|nr:autotransporter outer membrane beta-barrel domain-containing protein [Opitutaceae bacterium]
MKPSTPATRFSAFRPLESVLWPLLLLFCLQASAASFYWNSPSGTWFTPNGWFTSTTFGTPSNAPAASGTAFIEGGSVTIGLGVSATNALGQIGFGTGASGTAFVAGLWRNTNELQVGSGSNAVGYLKIEQTGTVISTSAGRVGQYGSGTAFVEGLWQSGGILYLARFAGSDGWLDIAQTGTVISSGGYVGGGNSAAVAGAGNATAFVSGLWRSNGDIIVGVGGGATGYLRIEQTGTVINTGIGRVGQYGSGTASVAGLWQSNDNFIIGRYANSDGWLDIEQTGTVSNATGYVGYDATATGTAIVAGLWNNTVNFNVGHGGSGYLKIEQTGTITDAAGFIGYNANSSGTAVVEGLWRNSGSFFVGFGGNGVLKIEQSGTVLASGASSEVVIANDTTAIGTVFVAGLLNTNNYLYVGYGGTGVLHIAETGTVMIPYGYIGFNAGSSGTAIVEGLWQHTDNFYIGRNANGGGGVLDITQTGTVSNNTGNVGYGANTTGTALVAGFWKNNGNLQVGYNGAGFLRIEQGGIVASNQGILAYNSAASSGTAFVAGLWENAVAVSVGRSGAGYLEIEQTGTVTNAVGYIGQYAGSNGTAIAEGLWQNSGSLSVGVSGTGLLDITKTGTVLAGGNYTQNAASTLAIELDAARADAHLTVGGAAILQGTLAITGFDQLDSYLNATKASDLATSAITIISATGGIIGDFATITGLDGGSSPDYIAPVTNKRGNGSLIDRYDVGYGLSWLAPVNLAHGTFTINAGDAFDVDVSLDARAGITSGWDGRSLTKLGDGLLTLSASNSYTGRTIINGGTLSLTGTYTGGGSALIGETSGKNGTLLVDGLWQTVSSGSVFAGYEGTGVLHIGETGTVANTYGYVGFNAGSSGTAFVEGLWQNSSNFYIGRNGDSSGVLVIARTGIVGASNVYLGGGNNASDTAASSGTAFVSGLWLSNSDLIVGTARNGTGYLKIESTGTVINNGFGRVGQRGGGTAIVDGYWQSGGAFYIGRYASSSGWFEITETGSASSDGGIVGYDANSSANATVAGIWMAGSGTLSVGNSGNGMLRITETGTVSNSFGIIGESAGGSGTAIVAGLWTNTGEVQVGSGSNAAGYLKVEQSGSVVSNSAGRVGLYGSGSAIVEGLWQSAGILYLARYAGSDGVLDITQTGTVVSGGGYVGGGNTASAAAAGTGTAFVSGVWLSNSGDLMVGAGRNSTGYLEIKQTGVITNTGIGRVGQYGSGTAIVAGLWQNDGNFILSRYSNSSGWLKIEQTGTVSNANAYIAYDANSNGTAIVEGLWQNSGSLAVGFGGSGYLKIEQTGTILATGASSEVAIASNTTATGTVFVAGLLNTNNYLYVGYGGTGVLHIAESGTVSSQYGYIGFNAGSSGTAIVEGLWQHTDNFYIGRNANGGGGVLDIIQTGTVSNNTGNVGYGANTTGTAIVAGFWKNNGNLLVGYNGAGFLRIEQGGIVASNQGLLAYNSAASSGTAFVAGLWENAVGVSVGRYGTGYIEIEQSGTITSAFGYIGQYEGGNGTAIVAGLWQSSGSLSVGVSGTGLLNITPTGSVTLGGNYTQNAISTLAIDLAPGHDTPYVSTDGSASLDGALIVNGFNGLIPSGTKASELVSDSILILRAEGGISGSFNAITAPGVIPPDYLVAGGYILENGTEYHAGYSLAWNGLPGSAHGTFAIPAGQSFDVDVPLGDRAGVTSGWDGVSLTKDGGGTLILSAQNSFTGNVTLYDGVIRLNGGAAARLGPVHFINGGEIDFGGPSNLAIGGAPGEIITPAYDGYRTLTLDSLDGSGDFRMKIDLSSGQSDQLIVNGDATGTFRLLIHPAAGPALPKGDEPVLTLVTISGLDGADYTGDFILPSGPVFTGGFDYGPFNYVFEQRDSQVHIVNNGFSTAHAPIRGVPGAQSLAWFGQQDNLGKRLGELRSAALENDETRHAGKRWDFWARARASQSDLDASEGMTASSLTLWGVEAGADKTWMLSEDKFSLGLFFGYGSGSQDFTLDASLAGTKASGGSDLLGGGLYALWFNSRGWFANATVTAARHKNNFDVSDQSGNHNTADYNDTTYGVSLEAGKRFTLGVESGWFAEPAALLSYARFDRSDYLTKGDMPMRVRNANATVTRLRGAVRAGRAWRTAGAGVIELAGRVAYVRESSMGGDVRIGSETWRPNLDGSRGEAGVGAIWRPLEKFHLYFDYEAACGDNYKKPWDISLGVRCQF